MDDQRRFRRQDDREQPPSEGVRIIGPDEAAEAIERGDVASRRGSDEPRYGDRPAGPPDGPRPALRFPLDAAADPSRIERPPVQPAPDPVTGPVELPHWTEPATGEVPAVLVGDSDPLLGGDDDDVEAWSSFNPSTPRWRDADDDWGDDDFVSSLSDHSEEVRVGAMADQDRPTHDEYYGFEDFDERVEERTSETRDQPRWAEEDDDWSASSEGTGDGWGSRRDDEYVNEDDDEYDDDYAERPYADDDSQAVEAVAADDEYADDYDEDYDESDEDDVDGVTQDIDGDLDDDAEAGFVDEDSEAVETIQIGAEDEFGELDTDDRTTGAAALGDDLDRETRDLDDDGGDPVLPAAPSGDRNMPMAVGVGAALAVVALIAMAIDVRAMVLVITAALAYAAYEYFTQLTNAEWETAGLLGVIACAAMPIAVYWRGPAAYGLMLFITLVAILAWYLVGAGGRDPRVLEGTGSTLFGVVWIGGLGSAAAAMLAMDRGRGLLIASILATVAYDVGGLFVGKYAGQRPLSAASPNKTLEGLIGGMGLAFVITIITVGIASLGPWNGFGAALVLGLGAACAAPLGDLCQSLVKRDLRIKDMGSILPGHGGVLDRFDSMLFVLPTVLWLTYAIGLG